MRQTLTSRKLKVAVATAAIAVTAGAGLAGATAVPNGNFERGTLSGWQKANEGPGKFRVYEGTFPSEAPPRGFTGTLPKPPQGKYAAVTFQNEESSMFLSRKLKLKAGQNHRLSFQLAWRNHNLGGIMARGGQSGFITPRTFDTVGQDNQQFRIDIMRPNAPIDSLQGNHILKPVFRSKVGERNFRRYHEVTENLNSLAGKTVRLRFAVAVTEAPLWLGVDAVRVRSKKD